jgi:hypothetical protein
MIKKIMKYIGPKPTQNCSKTFPLDAEALASAAASCAIPRLEVQSVASEKIEILEVLASKCVGDKRNRDCIITPKGNGKVSVLVTGANPEASL